MAGDLLEREGRSVEEQTQEISREELEHRRRMSERFRALIAGEDASAAEAPVGAYEYAPRAGYSQIDAVLQEHHEPVVPNSPEAPSAARRIADFIAIQPGMTSFRRMGDEPDVTVRDYAPVYEASAYEAPERLGARQTLFDRELDRAAAYDTAVMDPPAEAPYADGYEVPSRPVPETEPEEEEEGSDAVPTKRTMRSIERTQEAERRHSGAMSALSARAKIALAAVAAVIIVLLAIVCINTAVINSIDEQIAVAQDRLEVLTGSVDGMNEEIAQLTSPENVEAWAVAHGMSK